MKLIRLIKAIPLVLTLALSPVAAQQGTTVGPVVGPNTMADVMGTLNAAFLAIQSCNYGTSAPANGVGSAATLYECWADTTSNPTLFKRYDGASWVVWGSLNTSTHVWTPYWQGSPITSIATTASNTALTALINNFTASLSGAVPSPGSSTGKFLRDDATWQAISGSGTVTSWAYTNSTGMANTGTTPCTTTCSITFAIDKATAANYEAGTSNKVLTADNVFTSEVALTFGASQTFDFSTFLNASLTLTGNATSLTCSNMKANQSGTIRLIQDGTGSRTMVSTWCTAFVWAGGVKGVLSTAASAVDYLFYQCISTTVCFASLNKAVS